MPGIQPPRNLPGARIHEVVILALFRLDHEVFGDRHRNVEVAQVGSVFLRLDEPEHVRVRHVQDAHVRAPTGAALLDHVGGRIERIDEAHRARRHASGGTDDVALRPQPRKSKPRAASALVDQRGLFDLGEDGIQRILNRQHETRGELLQFASGVHQRRGVRQELQPPHHTVEPLLYGGALRVRGAVQRFRL